jgi:hypothetical protein
VHTQTEDQRNNAKKDSKSKTNYEYKDGFRAEKGKYISQLSVYYGKAEEQNQRDKKRRTITGFVLAPNYNGFDQEELGKYLCGDKYKYVAYSEIREFFKNNKKLTNGDKYIDDFINAMYKHTTPTDNEHRNELLQRLKYRIDSSN